MLSWPPPFLFGLLSFTTRRAFLSGIIFGNVLRNISIAHQLILNFFVYLFIELTSNSFIYFFFLCFVETRTVSGVAFIFFFFF